MCCWGVVFEFFFQACSSPVSARRTTTTLDAVLNPPWWSLLHDFLCCGSCELQCSLEHVSMQCKMVNFVFEEFMYKNCKG